MSAQQGGVFIESALSELPKDNWNFGFNLDMVLKTHRLKKKMEQLTRIKPVKVIIKVLALK